MRYDLLIAYGSALSVLIPLFISLLQGRSLSPEMKVLRLILVASMVCDGTALMLAMQSVNTHWIGNLYLAIQFLLLIMVFKTQFENKVVANLTLIFFSLFFIVNLSLFQGPMVFNSVSNVLACLILIAFCLYFFYRLMNDLPITHIHQLPMFWIAIAVLTYYAGNFFLFLTKNYLVYGDQGSHRLMWILHNLLNLAKNLLFAIALWQSYRKMKSSFSSASVP